VGVEGVLLVGLELLVENLVEGRSQLGVGHEGVEAGDHRRPEAGVENRCELVVEIRGVADRSGADSLQALDQRLRSTGPSGQGVGAVLLLARDRLGGPQKQVPEPREGLLDRGEQQIDRSDVEVAAVRRRLPGTREVDHRPADGGPGLVDPGA
jgi:hypothetical protein